MKKLILSLLIAFSFSALAQEREAGVRFRSLSNFDLIYKMRSEAGNYHRFRVIAINANALSRPNQTDVNFGFGLAYGFEKRKALGGKTSFIHGWEPALTASLSPNGQNIALELGYIIGLQYDFHQDFYINLEVVPSLGLNGSFINNNDPVYIGGMNLDTRFVSLSLVHRF